MINQEQLFNKKHISKEALNARELKKIYNYKEDVVLKQLNNIYGRKLKHSELKSIAFECSKKNHINLPREAYRRKPNCVKWFSDNWEVIYPFLSNIQIEVKDNDFPDMHDTVTSVAQNKFEQKTEVDQNQYYQRELENCQIDMFDQFFDSHDEMAYGFDF